MSLIVLIQKKNNFTTFALMLYKLLPGSNKKSPLLWQVSLSSQWSQKVCDLSSQAQLGNLNSTSIYPKKYSASNLPSNQPNALIYSAMEGSY